jgi:LysM repeat protein
VGRNALLITILVAVTLGVAIPFAASSGDLGSLMLQRPPDTPVGRAPPTASPAPRPPTPTPTRVPLPTATSRPATPTAVATESPEEPSSEVAEMLPELAGQPTPDGAQSHTVQAGDTLSGLALRYNSSIEAIRQANNMPEGSTLVRIGQQLVIPTP